MYGNPGGRQMKLEFYEEFIESHNIAANVRFFCIEATSAAEVVDKIIEKYIDEIGDFKNDKFFDMKEVRNYLHSILDWKGTGIYDMYNLDTNLPTIITQIDIIINTILENNDKH